MKEKCYFVVSCPSINSFLLASLIISNFCAFSDSPIIEEPIPEEFKPIIADMISGKRKPNKKAAAKLKIPAKERMRIALYLSFELGIIDVYKYDAVYPEGKGVVGLGAKYGREPIDVLRDLENNAKAHIQAYCNKFNVSNETIENLLRDLRKKMETWPNV